MVAFLMGFLAFLMKLGSVGYMAWCAYQGLESVNRIASIKEALPELVSWALWAFFGGLFIFLASELVLVWRWRLVQKEKARRLAARNAT